MLYSRRRMDYIQFAFLSCYSFVLKLFFQSKELSLIKQAFKKEIFESFIADTIHN